MDETATLADRNGPNHRGGGDDPGGIVCRIRPRRSPRKVIAVGPGAYDDKGTRRPLDVKEGDGLFTPHAGTEIRDKEYLILREGS